MTTRQRQGTGSASATLPSSNGNGTSTDRLLPFSWDDWFLHASSKQRAAILDLATQQGFVYPHQVPAVANGVKSATEPAPKSTLSALISDLLNGKAEGLTPPELDPVTFEDSELDSLQRQAVIR